MVLLHKLTKTSLAALAACILTAGACGERADRFSPTAAASGDSYEGEPPDITASAPEQVQDVDPFEPEVPCQTRYPVLLVHGVGGRDSDFGINYFGRIPDYLRENCRIEIFQGGQDAFSSSESNGEQLKEAILRITDELGYKKVNVIAHSKGGLDIRSMFFQAKGKRISGRTMNERVASFTTLSTPHRGSVLADFLLNSIGDSSQDLIATFLDVYGRAAGDSDDIDSSAALTELSTEAMRDFNERLGDLEQGIDGVYCQSWTSDVSGLNQNLGLLATSKIIDSLGFDVNDGAVQEDSTIYGTYRGVLGQDITGGIVHSALVDRPGGLGLDTGFDARIFYSDMLSELSSMGY